MNFCLHLPFVVVFVQWRVPEMRGTPKSSNFMGFSLVNHPAIGVPLQIMRPPGSGRGLEALVFIHGFNCDLATALGRVVGAPSLVVFQKCGLDGLMKCGNVSGKLGFFFLGGGAHLKVLECGCMNRTGSLYGIY